ncbi:hypothetical protein JL475_24415 [Streptomyces sp. M2CJ-2]|uniref:hypothetical protein n=1 Tax=Streptomyces sp. M2CJ-2 TaxID=2803948 RepID=UPI0019278EC6|nr:hypothetical protein [Streptomyces sp. M2CJ-2]MBL3669080.1 hypothetical protein [Streptomyces sp. M2CJ-2]
MADLTQPPDIDVALRVLLTEPSYGAQVLIVTARMLELDSTEPLTRLSSEHALDIAADTILRNLPDVVCSDSMSRAYRALPPLAQITRGEYALRLRAAAKELG